MRISEEIIEKVKEQNDIVDVVSDVVRLKRAGRNFSGLCPFHHEKSPSFSVSPDKQIFKCFGCGEAGNVISFVMKTKNLNFVDAVKELADRANIIIPIEDGKQSESQRKKQVLYNINKQAARYYFSNLQNNKEAKEYFFRRGIKENILKSFGLGYAKEGWQNTINYLRKQGFNNEAIEAAGLGIKSEKGTFYDRFRNRVIFPVFDYKGSVIGFGGRVLDDSKPKYLNSPETLVFHKGTNLYALNFAIKHGLKERTLIIVEGYMDCISLHQYGITNVVASLGTALTDNQARLLKRYVDRVIISYDADIAGQMATIRGLEILQNAGLDVRVLTVPKGKDPDEFIRANGKEAFIKLIQSAKKLIDYKLDRARIGIDFSDNNGLIKYAERVVNVLSDLNPIEKDVYIKRISEETSIKEQAFYDLLNKNLTNSNKNHENVNNKEEYGTKLYVEPPYVKCERSVLKLLCMEENHSLVKKYLEEDDLISPNIKSLEKIINDSINEVGFGDLEKHVEAKCEDPKVLKEWLEVKDLLILDHSSNIEVLVKDYVNLIKKYKLEQEQTTVLKELKRCEQNNMFKESLDLVKRAKEISDKLKELERSK